MDLLEADAPQTVASFVSLANDGYFDGLAWHRVLRGFVIQTGEPNNVNGAEPDGPGYTFDDELGHVQASDYTFGAVAMANAGANTNGSQWFVVVHDPESGEPAGLDPLYTVFGSVPEADWDVLDQISKQPVESSTGGEPSSPVNPIVVEKITITER
jgi:cyclophilin family peptidyl-prolyl cis-trans isomerase